MSACPLVDCHTHTSFSDGHASFEDNVHAAAAAGCRVMVSTDHLTLPASMDANCEVQVTEGDLTAHRLAFEDAHKLAAQLPFTDDAPVHHTSDPDGMRAALNNIYSSRGLQPQDEAAMVGYLYLFIAALMRETSAGKPHTASSSSQYVLNAIKYIQFNYSHDISIDDVAKSVGVSRSHLYRVFMLNVGKSPIDYLTEYRINEACKLLRAGHLSIAEVAVSVGFFDQFYFSRVFKRAKGVPPSKYFATQADAAPAEPQP